MARTEHVENLVLGGGEAGKYVAWELAKEGRPVVVVERELVGGSCPNVACLPSKNIIRSAEVAHLARTAGAYGLSTGKVSVNMQGVRQRKREMVAGMIDIHRQRFAAPGIEFVMAEGRLVGPRTVETRTQDGSVRRFETEHLYLNLGTHAAVPDLPGMAAAQPLTNVEALELGELPDHLLVLGGGYVGVELAQAFRRLGSRVTLLQLGEQLLPREDTDVAQAVQALFEDEGIEVVLGAETRSVAGRSGAEVHLQVSTEAGERTVVGSHLLVATGRTPNTHGIGLEESGIELDERGYVKVDEQLRATAPGVWALGECAGSPQFTHVAFDDFRVVRSQLKGGEGTTSGRLVPYCAFIDPQLARVGLDERTAAAKGIAVRVAHIPMAKVLRARAIGEIRGFMKMLIGINSDEILGFTMFGKDAGEVVAVVQMAMLGGLPYTALRDAILTHPTMAEGLTVLLADVPAHAGGGAH